jgi:hypothetical protein
LDDILDQRPWIVLFFQVFRAKTIPLSYEKICLRT